MYRSCWLSGSSTGLLHRYNSSGYNTNSSVSCWLSGSSTGLLYRYNSSVDITVVHLVGFLGHQQVYCTDIIVVDFAGF